MAHELKGSSSARLRDLHVFSSGAETFAVDLNRAVIVMDGVERSGQALRLCAATAFHLFWPNYLYVASLGPWIYYRKG